jgi:hypothetical protein
MSDVMQEIFLWNKLNKSTKMTNPCKNVSQIFHVDTIQGLKLRDGNYKE